MHAVRDLSHRVVGGLSGDVLYNTRGDVCAFIRGREVFTFNRRPIGHYEQGLFRSVRGEIVGTIGDSAPPPQERRRRRRWEITPWLRFSLPAPKPAMAFRTWAIWDHAIETLSA